eukprot:scaffold522_cov168-Amphora_coffeaeformis.AAC.8
MPQLVTGVTNDSRLVLIARRGGDHGKRLEQGEKEKESSFHFDKHYRYEISFMSGNHKDSNARKSTLLQCEVKSRCEKEISKLLKDAVKAADVSTVKFLISKGALPTASMLEYAVRKRNLGKIVALLSHEKASTIFSVETRQQALVTAINLGHPSVVSALLGAGKIEPNFVINESYGECTPLHIAISNSPIVKILLENGANPNARCSYGRTPLHDVGGNHESARMLIAHGGDPNVRDDSGNSPLHMICCEGEILTAKEMDMADFEIQDEEHWTALHCAISSRDMDLIQWLLERGANPNPPGRVLPLQTAFKCRMMPLPLIALGMDPWHRNTDGKTIAHFAVWDEDIKNNYYDDDVDGGSNTGPSEDFHLRFVDSLFHHDPSLIHAQDHNGNQPIHYAGKVSPDTIRALVQKYGADLAAVNGRGENCLITAVNMADDDKNDDAVETILVLMKERDLSIDTADKKGWAALHYSVFRRKDSTIRLLLEFGCDVTQLNLCGRSALHLAGFAFSTKRDEETYGDHDISRVLKCRKYPAYHAEKDKSTTEGLQDLLARGADATLLDKDGNLPFFLAAATSRVSETFLMIRAAATQGLFVSKNQGSDGSNKRKRGDGRELEAKHSKSNFVPSFLPNFFTS